MRPKYPKLKFNTLRAYFGKPYVIDLENCAGSVTVYSPTMGDAYINNDENDFMATLNMFTTNTTSLRVFLDDLGMDWNEVTDFQLFILLYKQTNPEVIKLLFGDLDLHNFELCEKRGKDDSSVIVLYTKEQDIEINEDVYQHIHQYLQMVFHIEPDEKITNDKFLKKLYLDKDRFDAAYQAKKKKGKEESGSIQPLISACVNHPGFKYKLSEVENMGVAEFYDAVSRLNIYENTRALLQGSYSGMCDTSKISKEQFNWMREIEKK